MLTLAQSAAEPVMLMSIVKPVIMLLVLGGWAWVVSQLDKDAAYFFLQRYAWNGAQLGAGAAAFGLWLLIPVFWIGMPLALLILGGAIFGYATYRNTRVPPDRKWSMSLESFRQRVEEVQQERAQRRAMLVMMSRDEAELEVPTGDEPRALAHQALEKTLEFSLARGADRFDIAVDAQKAAMAVRIDGVKYPQPPIEPRIAVALIDYLKAAADLDVADRRRRQQGKARIRWGESERHTLEVMTYGSTQSMAASVAIDPVALGNIAFDKLGLLDAQKARLREALKEKGGVVIDTSPGGQGQTTTLYSIVQTHDPYTQNIIAFEVEKAYDMEGINHQVRPPVDDPNANYEALAALLRQDPDVVMIDRLLDAKMAQMVAKTAEEVRFYVGLNQTDTFMGLKAWIKACGDAQVAGDALRAVLTQRLVRKLCPTCRVPYTPDADALRKLNLPADKVTQLFRASGKVKVGKDKEKACPTCFGIGYRGRFAVFETMVLDDEARRLVQQNQIETLRAHLRKQRMLYLQEAALARVVEGVTDIKEITRALSNEK